MPLQFDADGYCITPVDYWRPKVMPSPITDLGADDRCACGALLATHDGMHGQCAGCRKEQHDELTMDQEEYD